MLPSEQTLPPEETKMQEMEEEHSDEDEVKDESVLDRQNDGDPVNPINTMMSSCYDAVGKTIGSFSATVNTPRSQKDSISARSGSTPSEHNPTLDGTILDISSDDLRDQIDRSERDEARDQPQPLAMIDAKKGRRLRTSSTMSCGYEDSDSADQSVSTSLSAESSDSELTDHAFERKKRHLNVLQRKFAAWFIKQDWKSQRRI